MTQPRSGAAKPIQPASVNRELDGLRTILNNAVEWGKLLESPARNVKRLKVDNRRTRILTDDEQRAILAARPRKLRAIVLLALITGARIGELLALRWADCEDGFVPFWEAKNGKVRRHPYLSRDQSRVGPNRPWSQRGHKATQSMATVVNRLRNRKVAEGNWWTAGGSNP